MILFLDFDGVLHPDAVYLRLNGQVELRAEGALFMWAVRLAAALQSYPEVRIVLSTSWVRHLGFSRARKALPADLAAKVIGANWHSATGKGWPDYKRVLFLVPTCSVYAAASAPPFSAR